MQNPLPCPPPGWHCIFSKGSLCINSGFRYFLEFSPQTLGFHDPIWLYNIFQMGWNSTTNSFICATEKLGGFMWVFQRFRIHPGALAPLVGVLLNLYAWIDVVAVVPSLMDWAYKRDESLGSKLCIAVLVDWKNWSCQQNMCYPQQKARP